MKEAMFIVGHRYVFGSCCSTTLADGPVFYPMGGRACVVGHIDIVTLCFDGVCICVDKRQAVVAVRRFRLWPMFSETLLQIPPLPWLSSTLLPLEIIRWWEEHCARNEGRNATKHENRPHHTHENGPRGAEATVETTLEHVSELNREQSECAVGEDQAPPDDTEPGEPPDAPENGEEGEHDPAYAHAPQ